MSSDSRIETLLAAELNAISADFSTGRIDEAHARLQRIVMLGNPTSSSAKELGNACAKLGYSALAGRFWYLLEDKTAEMVSACREFERSCGDNPGLIRYSLMTRLPTTDFAKQKLQELKVSAEPLEEEHRALIDGPKTIGRWLRERLVLVGCASVLFVLLFVFVAGIMAIIHVAQSERP